MNISEAIDFMKNSKKGSGMRLPYWTKGISIKLQETDENSKMTEDYLYLETTNNKVPWTPSIRELLSDEWIIEF